MTGNELVSNIVAHAGDLPRATFAVAVIDGRSWLLITASPREWRVMDDDETVRFDSMGPEMPIDLSVALASAMARAIADRVTGQRSAADRVATNLERATRTIDEAAGEDAF